MSPGNTLQMFTEHLLGQREKHDDEQKRAGVLPSAQPHNQPTPVDVMTGSTSLTRP